MGWTEADLAAFNRRQADPALQSVEHPAVPLPKPEYNSKTEQLRAQALELDQRAGMIKGWSYETVTLKLPGGSRYTPDFLIEHNDGTVSFEEVKGRKGSSFFARPIGKMKVGIAAAVFRHWRFVVIFPGSRLGMWDKWEVPIR